MAWGTGAKAWAMAAAWEAAGTMAAAMERERMAAASEGGVMEDRTAVARAVAQWEVEKVVDEAEAMRAVGWRVGDGVGVGKASEATAANQVEAAGRAAAEALAAATAA